MFYNCCVQNCNSRRKTVKLFKFRKTEVGYLKWLKCVPDGEQKSVEELKKMFVCAKHFEKRCFTSKFRLHYGAYPTLFTADEIGKGKPDVSDTSTENPSKHKIDHSYSKVEHIDHNYCKKGTNTAEIYTQCTPPPPCSMTTSVEDKNDVQENNISSTILIEFLEELSSPIVTYNSGYSNETISWMEGEKYNGLKINVTLLTGNKGITKDIKQQCAIKINNQITSKLVTLGLQSVLCRVRVNVLALSCEAPCVRLLAASLTAPLDVESLPRDFLPVFDTYIQRQNILEEALRELTNIVKQNEQSRSSEEIYIYALYSIPDFLCRLIT